MNKSASGLLQRNTFLVKERVGFAKLTDTFDILDPGSGQTIGLAKEEPPGWAKWLRLVLDKKLMPTTVNVYEEEGRPPVFSIQRGVALFGQTVHVRSGEGQPLGYFKSKLFSVGGGFHVFDNHDQEVANIKGDWKGWSFKFLSQDGREIGTVTKKWGGLGKELFTSADNYMIALHESVIGNPAAVTLMLAAGLAIDMVFKEKGG